MFAARSTSRAGGLVPTNRIALRGNSGVNGTMVEFASLAKERGHRLVAITSAQHSGRMTSWHPSAHDAALEARYAGRIRRGS
ncbi:hypothetical protein [Micromonospora sp. KC606]|uniref:hypothetical protein n=1 Tax=Micromonospora sp. KC606 TaxID=2530379 RepID=UPI001FB773BB|nr:hypothetical protein [Micromonospora sp. KC606]